MTYDSTQNSCEALRSLAEIISSNNLKHPAAIHFWGFRSITIRLDDNEIDGIDQWAQALNLTREPSRYYPAGRTMEEPAYTRMAASATADAPFWCGFRRVLVWTEVERTNVRDLDIPAVT